MRYPSRCGRSTPTMAKEFPPFAAFSLSGWPGASMVGDFCEHFPQHFLWKKLGLKPRKPRRKSFQKVTSLNFANTTSLSLSLSLSLRCPFPDSRTSLVPSLKINSWPLTLATHHFSFTGLPQWRGGSISLHRQVTGTQRPNIRPTATGDMRAAAHTGQICCILTVGLTRSV